MVDGKWQEPTLIAKENMEFDGDSCLFHLDDSYYAIVFDSENIRNTFKCKKYNQEAWSNEINFVDYITWELKSKS